MRNQLYVFGTWNAFHDSRSEYDKKLPHHSEKCFALKILNRLSYRQSSSENSRINADEISTKQFLTPKNYSDNISGNPQKES